MVIISLSFSYLAHGASDAVDFPDDSVEVSLLTCEPHDEVYALYGHSAIRYHDLRTGEDWIFNYGVFNFKKSFFVLRFLFGITDYELGVVPFSVFYKEYKSRGSAVTEQVLNLTHEEKMALLDFLNDNYKPENRVYRYNFIFDNCTTRARGAIEHCLSSSMIKYSSQFPMSSLNEDCDTYRKLLHKYTEGHPWAQFGDDLCLGFRADFVISWRERQFLPEELMADFQEGHILSDQAGVRSLVKQTRLAVEPGVHFINAGFPLTPLQCFTLLLLLSIGIAILEIRRHRTFSSWDVLLMTIIGLSGIIVMSLMFSCHPTTSTNLQVLLLCPAALFFIPNVFQHKQTRYWKLSLFLIILFFLGSFLQDYAEGMKILALCLLIRVCVNLYLGKRFINNKKISK
ncbi:MAG: DUF4105 domain-containing protein [Prevotella sp.]